jgi:tetratricopeptide (TPR) repeat protein
LVTLRVGGLSLNQVVFPGRLFTETFALLEVVGFANLWMLAFSLLPQPVGRQGLASDGTQLLLLPFRKRRLLDETLVVGAVLEAYELTDAHDQDRAEALIEAAMRRFPQSWIARSSRAVVQLRRGWVAEARATFLTLLAEEPPSPWMGALLRSNLAWTAFQLRDPNLRQEADEYSSLAYARLKRVSAVISTRGAILFWLGRPEEALPLLERAYLLEGLPANRASVACVLSMTNATLRRTADAGRWLDRARTNDPACPFLSEAEAAGSGVPVPGKSAHRRELERRSS